MGYIGKSTFFSLLCFATVIWHNDVSNATRRIFYENLHMLSREYLFKSKEQKFLVGVLKVVLGCVMYMTFSRLTRTLKLKKNKFQFFNIFHRIGNIYKWQILKSGIQCELHFLFVINVTNKHVIKIFLSSEDLKSFFFLEWFSDITTLQPI